MSAANSDDLQNRLREEEINKEKVKRRGERFQ